MHEPFSDFWTSLIWVKNIYNIGYQSTSANDEACENTTHGGKRVDNYLLAEESKEVVPNMTAPLGAV